MIDNLTNIVYTFVALIIITGLLGLLVPKIRRNTKYLFLWLTAISILYFITALIIFT